MNIEKGKGDGVYQRKYVSNYYAYFRATDRSPQTKEKNKIFKDRSPHISGHQLEALTSERSNIFQNVSTSIYQKISRNLYQNISTYIYQSMSTICKIHHVIYFMATDGSHQKRGNEESDSVDLVPISPRLLTIGC